MKFLRNCKKYLYIVFLLLGVVFLLLGAFSGQFQDILRKSTMVCLECIGVG